MAENTKIAWADDTFNPWWGCMKVGPGCDNCYAAALDKRTGGDHWGNDLPRRTSEQNWNKPRKWNKQAEASGVRRKVFCASMADVFDNRVPCEWRGDLWALIRETPHLDWILVTKRIGNVSKMLPDDWGNGYPNVWLLITVVNQEEADRDIPKLLATTAAVRGLSVEPQIADVDIVPWCGGRAYKCDCEKPWHHTEINRLAFIGMKAQCVECGHIAEIFPTLDWVICGAESGAGRRPFNIDWARSLRDQCHDTGTAFFLKQMPANTPKGVVETPELDGQQWMQFPLSHLEVTKNE